MKINVKALKSKLSVSDIEKILKALNVPIASKGENWRLYTGCHHKNAYDGGKNLIFYPSTKMFQCVSSCCCSFDIISLVQKRLALNNQPSSFYDAVNCIAKTVGIDIGDVEKKTEGGICNWQDDLEKFVRIKRGESLLQNYDPSILNQLDELYPEDWIKEGISIETMKKYGIKWYSRCNQICIPCRDKEGNLIGIRCRNTDEDKIVRAKYIPLSLLDGTTYKFNTNQVFFNINYAWEGIERTKTVLLFESEKSCMKYDQMTKDNNSLALYGSQVGMKRRDDLLKMGVEKVALCLDSDFENNKSNDYFKFEKKILDISKLFKGYTSVEVVYNNVGLTDFYKHSPVDDGLEIWELLWNSREAIV